MRVLVPRSPVVAVGLIAGLTMGAAELIGGGSAWSAAISSAIPFGYAILVTLLARRSETASVLAGRPVDERWELMNQEAAAWALGIVSLVVLGAFVAVNATGGDWTPYAFIAAVMAAAYAGSLAYLRLRG